jgi:AcrR family transcriptional regulator
MAITLRERRRQLLRDEILEAAHALLTEKSYAAISMEELAARVGVSKPTLYAHFPAKEDVVVAMALQVLERIFAYLAAADPDESPLERLVGLLRAAVRLQLERRSDAMQLYMPEIVAILESHAELRAQICRIDSVVVDLIHAAVAAGEIAGEADVASVARIFYALICTPNLGRLSVVGPPEPAALVESVAAFFRHGLAPGRDRLK